MDGERAGHLWIGPLASDDHEHWWVWDIEIDEAWRGRGVGRAAMEFAEREARARGCREIGLSVIADNTPRTAPLRVARLSRGFHQDAQAALSRTASPRVGHT